ncbi:hypothetical protein [Sphingomonas oryzagri]
MNEGAIEKAGLRVDAAEQAYNEICALESDGKFDFMKFARLWSQYLSAWKGVYTVLEQGAKGSAESEAWFEAAKQARIADPILNYLYHARNADEHGLKRVVGFTTGTQVFELDQPATGFEKLQIERNRITGQFTASVDGSPIRMIASSGPGFALEPVHKRNGRQVGPPLYSGDQYDFLTPRRAAEMGLEHIRNIIEAAAALV